MYRLSCTNRLSQGTKPTVSEIGQACRWMSALANNGQTLIGLITSVHLWQTSTVRHIKTPLCSVQTTVFVMFLLKTTTVCRFQKIPLFGMQTKESVLGVVSNLLGNIKFGQMADWTRRSTTTLSHCMGIYKDSGLIKVQGNGLPFSYNGCEVLDGVTVSQRLLVTPKYASTSVNKFLSTRGSVFEFQFLRKNKVYNKGRYSRCRQNYRTGVYMCMYLSILCIFGLYYYFYKFSFNFTYLWWFFIAFFGSFFIPKIVKYRLYEPSTLLLKSVECGR